MKMRNLFVILVLMGLFTACNKDTPYIPDDPTDDPVTFVTGNILGFVGDESGEAVINADVRIGSKETTTDEYGFFKFDQVSLSANGAYLTVEKTGYFHGSRRFIPGNGTNNVKITLLEKEIIGSIMTSSGGEVETNGGAKVRFEAGSLLDASGNAYSGEVQVAARWINPGESSVFDQMPGNLTAVDAEGAEVGLATFGMMAVELQSPSGEELQPNADNGAILEMPVPAELLSNAPTEIPLWYFDEDKGLWIEEGFATLSGNVYSGKVSHFSFWNCDAPFPVVGLTGCVVDRTGNPVTMGVSVSIEVQNSGLTSSGLVNSTGCFGGDVPMNELMTMNILGPCDEVIFSMEIGPFADDADLGTIQIPDLDAALVAGKVLDCNGTPVDDGYCILKWENLVFGLELDANGDFSTYIPYCEGVEASLTPINSANQEAGATVEFELETVNEFNALQACGGLIDPPYFLLKINGVEMLNLSDSLQTGGDSYLSDGYVVDGNSFGITGDATKVDAVYNDFTTASYDFSLAFPGTQTGTFEEAYLDLSGILPTGEEFSFSGLHDFTTLIVSEYGNSNEPLRIYFEVLLEDGGESYDVSGTLITTVQ
ncbi:MAG: carboxypeptidase regulatory-like domain-containing protein [Bacteroidetes bacterium]|nr:carboxypeptidase regulatory-like domain-containing protein [Bacteroidota bacterium]